jgi:Na+-transporting NADH:ubiquinone oxidoreductase subunit A
LDAGEASGHAENVRFESFSGRHPRELSRDQVRELLLESGLWTAIRMRPFSRVARPGDAPHSVFVTAMDSQPLAAPVDLVLAGRDEDFERGLHALAKLTEGAVYVCKRPGSAVRVPSGPPFQTEEFSGPHPAGAVGVHIHTLDPVSRARLVWHAHCQDVIAIGRLFRTGAIDPERVISLAGPSVRQPRLLRTRQGASVNDLVRGNVADGENRLISGSVLSGRAASGEIFGYLGRYHHQISVIPEDRHREFLGWL